MTYHFEKKEQKKGNQKGNRKVTGGKPKKKKVNWVNWR